MTSNHLLYISNILPSIFADEAKNSKRDLQQVLKEAAETAESIGKKALKFVMPEMEQPGAAILKPFLKKRNTKRSVAVQQPQTTYNWPYYNPTYIQRSAIPYPGSAYANYYQWNSNPSWNLPYQRSVVPYSQPYYQQAPSSSGEGRILNAKKMANEVTDKQGLDDFQKLISNVDSALLSFNDKSGVELTENLKGVEKDSKKRGKIKKSKKRSKMTKKQAKDELKKITKTFTDFICGNQC